jgi:hypothetical protein
MSLALRVGLCVAELYGNGIPVMLDGGGFTIATTEHEIHDMGEPSGRFQDSTITGLMPQVYGGRIQMNGASFTWVRS